jgi:hypothetical protein
MVFSVLRNQLFIDHPGAGTAPFSSIDLELIMARIVRFHRHGDPEVLRI